LIRHGESLWNEKNLFTGCVDVPLTPKGVEEAIEAGKRICNIPIDVIYTSSLIRAQMTAMLAMMQHRRKKVCVSSLYENVPVVSSSMCINCPEKSCCCVLCIYRSQLSCIMRVNKLTGGVRYTVRRQGNSPFQS
jgi:phosphohistidine phosphatase SixA